MLVGEDEILIQAKNAKEKNEEANRIFDYEDYISKYAKGRDVGRILL